MNTIWTYIQRLVGNGKSASIGIFLFILLLAFMFWHSARAAEVDLQAGSSFGTEGYGPVLGLTYRQSIQPGLNWYAGTDLWGTTQLAGQTVNNNFDWHLGLEGCKGRFCAGIGPAFVQRIDAINGAHTNFYLGVRYALTDRCSLVIGHISDAGTTVPNIGRQMISLTYRFQ